MRRIRFKVPKILTRLDLGVPHQQHALAAADYRRDFLVIGAPNQRTCKHLCTDVIERLDLTGDLRFISNSDHLANIALFEPLLESEFAKRRRGYLDRTLRERQRALRSNQ